MSAEFDKSEVAEYLLDDWVLCLMTEELPLKLEYYKHSSVPAGGGGFGGPITFTAGSGGASFGSAGFSAPRDPEPPETVYGLPVVDSHWPAPIREIEMHGHYFRRSIASSEDDEDWIDIWIEKKWFRTTQKVGGLTEFIEAGHRHAWLTPDEFLEEVQFLAVDL